MPTATQTAESPSPGDTNSLLVQCRAFIDDGNAVRAKELLEPMLRSLQAEPEISRASIDALLLYANAQRQTGNFRDSLNNLHTVLQRAPDLRSDILPAIFHCLANLKQIPPEPGMQSYVEEFLKAEFTDNEFIDRLCVTLLKQILHLDEGDYELEVSDIANEKLILAALPKLFLADPDLELFFNELRQYLLAFTLEEGMRQEIAPLVQAMALRGFNNEYVNFVTDNEKEIIAGLQTTLAAQLPGIDNLVGVSHVILILGMYVPIGDLPCQQIIRGFSYEHWPDILKPLVKSMLFDRDKELALGAEIPSLSTISDLVSNKVRQQYEANPYPRWNSAHIRPQPISYLEGYHHLHETTHNAIQFDKPLDCLVAGCGTGKHPIICAKNFSHLNITAIDLSMASLSYAKRKAGELDANNIAFKQCDILDVDLLDQQFDLIECAGVLHHMDDPELGLKRLLQVLKPGGLIYLGLYSELARVEITRLRHAYHSEGQSASPDGIRTFRQTMLTTALSDLMISRDFYSLSSCRDLLFHEQEHQFTLPKIERLLTENDLHFAGFHSLDEFVTNSFRQQFPDDPHMLNLDHWHEYETAHPKTFQQMYQFHCQKGA